jgi:hypothetical protein
MFVSTAWQLTQLWILLPLGAFALAFVIGAVYLSCVALALDKLIDLKAARALLSRWIVGYQIVLLILSCVRCWSPNNSSNRSGEFGAWVNGFVYMTAVGRVVRPPTTPRFSC